MRMNTSGINGSNLFGTDANYEKYKQLQQFKKDYRQGKLAASILKSESSEEQTETEKYTNDLYQACLKLNSRGKESLLRSKDAETTEKLETAVNNFVESYNALVKAGVGKDEDGETVVDRNIAYMMEQTGRFEESLAKVGITIGEETGLLTLDKEKLAEADLDSLRKVFLGNSSLAGRTQQSILQISIANHGVSTDTTGTYGKSGKYMTGNHGYSSYDRKN